MSRPAAGSRGQQRVPTRVRVPTHGQRRARGSPDPRPWAESGQTRADTPAAPGGASVPTGLALGDTVTRGHRVGLQLSPMPWHKRAVEISRVYQVFLTYRIYSCITTTTLLLPPHPASSGKALSKPVFYRAKMFRVGWGAQTHRDPPWGALFPGAPRLPVQTLSGSRDALGRDAGALSFASRPVWSWV